MTPVLTVAYDANGNTLTDAQGRSFTWDFENRLIQAVVPGSNGGSVLTFKYDPFGRRIQKSGPGWEVRSGLARGGFALHLGTFSEGCINVDKNDPDARQRYLDLLRMLDAEQGDNFLYAVP